MLNFLSGDLSPPSRDINSAFLDLKESMSKLDTVKDKLYDKKKEELLIKLTGEKALTLLHSIIFIFKSFIQKLVF